MSKYLDKVRRGDRVIIRDEKKGAAIAQITALPFFDKESYQKSLKKASGIFSSEAHPEWKTKKGVMAWLNKSRLADDRKF
ncbi:MAG: hypothetical protein US96_C0039G0009 [Candidatus Woesebacteria bacterium GW2011_GWB1_38_5b]|uniref:Uncharacterized protein n=1 Tax=Candidatus Woesebacteria bacterium GW2011_GWB1_38_5b TaxID=1618569 RepID=A0A0G0K3A0_9BACT|nr:MAG: hypothetical protein US96_C0039G0009 [Candidatus Woesebacteria bacterium GW2011_GWB1_38_5b]